MSLRLTNISKKEENTVHFQSVNTKNLLLIFTRNPVLGKCKTRLAATIGNEAALNIYKFLLHHTSELTKGVNAHKQVFYSEEIWHDDTWNPLTFEKLLQEGDDLGERMANAFQKGFEKGFENIIVIGSDMYELGQQDITDAFIALNQNQFVLGPAKDGGYYLLGMKNFNPSIFKNKNWGTNTVLQDTLNDIGKSQVYLLEEKNDIDLFEDIKNIKAFEPYLK